MRYYVELTDATQYATVYDTATGGPVGTLRRRHSFDKRDQPRWKLFDMNGTEIGAWFLPRSYDRMVKEVNRVLERRYDEES